MYLKNGKVKVELALAKGKKLYDKRQDLAKKDANRRIERELSGRYQIMFQQYNVDIKTEKFYYIYIQINIVNGEKQFAIM